MATIQVKEWIKQELFTIAADLQRKRSRRDSLNGAIGELIKSYRGETRDKRQLLSLFGSIAESKEARGILHELRKNETRRLESIETKYSD